MPFLHGKKSKFSIDDSAGTLRDVSAYCDTAALARALDTAEVTTFGSDAKSYIAGLTDATVPFAGKFDNSAATAIDAVIALAFGQAATVSWEYQPSNAAVSSTNPKYTGEGFVTKYEISSGVGDAVMFSAELQVSGTITRATA